MMPKLKKKLAHSWGIIASLLLALSVVITNFQADRWLLGWDNLVPEFNLSLNLQRAFVTVWQEYQGVGVLGGMGHGADLVRQLILLALSVVFPIASLRFVIVLTGLTFGVVGAFLGIKEQLSTKKSKFTQLAAVLGASFYLFNFGTIQNFYVPFEPFYWFYAVLPWLVWSLTLLLKKFTLKRVGLFLLLSVLATPIGYVQTTFIVYVLFLAVFLLGWLVGNRSSWGGSLPQISDIKKSSFLGLLVILINAFWLLPVIYFTLTSSNITVNATINTLATPDVSLQNQAHANFKSISRLFGYWFDLQDSGTNGDQVYLMNQWREHFSKPQFIYLGYFWFGLVSLGIVALFVKKSKWRWSYVWGFILGYMMLSGESPPLGILFHWIKTAIPLFEQIFRSPFTKWIVIMIWIYSVLFSFAWILIFDLVHKVSKKLSYLTNYCIGLLVIAGLIFYVSPLYSGNLFYPRAVVNLPQEYLKLFEYFNTQPKSQRIAFFPMQTLWGWNFYDWGYRGSGFLWYGIEQPVLDRAFDVWSPYNEAFYLEAFRAIYDKDVQQLGLVIQKYDVRWFLVDKHVVNGGQSSQLLYYDEFSKELEALGATTVWNEGDLFVYDLESLLKDEFPNVSISPKTTLLTPSVSYMNQDPVYDEIGNYFIAEIPGYSQQIRPFYGFNSDQVTGINFSQTLLGREQLSLSQQFNNYPDSQLIVPNFEYGQLFTTTANFSLDGNQLRLEFIPPIDILMNGVVLGAYDLPQFNIELEEVPSKLLINIEGDVLELQQGQTEYLEGVDLRVGQNIEVSLFDANQSELVDISDRFNQAPIVTCWERQAGQGQISTDRVSGKVTIDTQDASACLSVYLGNFEDGKDLLQVTLPYISDDQSRPHFCVIDASSQQYRCLHEDVFYKSGQIPSEDISQVSRWVVIPNNSEYWMDLVARPPEAANTDWQITYLTPEIKKYRAIQTYSFGKEIWTEFMKPEAIHLDTTETIVDIRLRTFEDNVDFLTETRPELSKCSLLGAGEIARNVTDNHIIYTSSDGAAGCDFVHLEQISAKFAHIIRFKGENIAGRSLKFFVNHLATGRNILERLLPQGEYEDYYILTPWNFSDDLGYRLAFENYSLGGEESINRLDKVEVYELPLDWLSKIRVERSPANSQVQSDLILKDVTKVGTYKYIVYLTGKEGVINLSQGFNSGWVAFNVSTDSSWLSTYFPWFFGDKLVHGTFNNWSNGWYLRSDSPELHKVVIIFWPQYLEFLGFGLVGLVVVVLLFRVLAHKRFIPKSSKKKLRDENERA